jgi:hypothetical protein
LTARVFVNRVWLRFFGAGLVRTPSNFGKLGEPPTHPRLLDWLARQFMASGWSVKALHRAVLLSSTYQMNSQVDAKAYARDGGNRLLWRMSPRRLDVETWRDALLAVSGGLDPTLGGPSTQKLLESPRRTLYAAISRNGDRLESDAFLTLFDFPSPRLSSAKRNTSTVPQQFLFMLNSPFMQERARSFSRHVATQRGDDGARIDLAYQVLYLRSPTNDERQAGLDFLAAEPSSNELEGLTPWEQYAQVLLSAGEFLYVR